jgi:hypothetical protein
MELLRGEPMTFTEIGAFLRERGIKTSRSRWSYMLNGDVWRVRDRALLDALSEVLDVPREFLYVGEVSPELSQGMRDVRSMRAARVERYAARALGDLAPETLDVISAALRRIDDEEAAGRHGEA